MIRLTDEELQKLVKEREEFIIPFGYDIDWLLDFKFYDEQLDDFWIITRLEIVDRYFELEPDTEWKLNGIYQLDDIFYDVVVFDSNEKGVCIHDELNYLFHFSKFGSDNVEIGFNSSLEEKLLYYNLGYADFWEDNGINKDDLEIKKYMRDSDQFSLEIHSVLLPNKKISHDLFDSLDIVPIKRKNFINSYLCLLSRYKKNVTDFYGFPTAKEECKPLNEIVKLVEPPDIQPGDILISGYYLNDYIDDNHGYFNPELRIIKENDVEFLSKNIVRQTGQAILRCPERICKYLCIYLYYRAVIVNEFIIYNNIPYCDSLMDLPVFIPEGDLSKYDEIYDKFEVPPNKLRLNDKKTKLKSTEQLMDKYMDEFEKCINSKAYTAALIMAGSVLEAFLIDWIADEPDIIDSDNLEDCINKLRDKYGFENPPWDARTAHIIRKRRNLVHPKKLLKIMENEKINREMCDEAYVYLKYIIDYRNRYGKKGKA